MPAPTPQNDAFGSGDGTSFTPTKPVGTANGDLLIGAFTFEKGSDVTLSGGISQWTLIRRENQAANVGLGVYYRVEDGTALSAITLSTAAKFAWTVHRVTDQDSLTPLGNVIGANGSSGNPDPAAITVEVDELAYEIMAIKNSATLTTPSTGYTERWDHPNTGSGIPANAGASKVITSAGSENPSAITPSGTAEWATVTFAVIPIQGNVDAETLYLDLQPSGIEQAEVVDSAEVYLSLTPSGVELFTTVPAQDSQMTNHPIPKIRRRFIK